MFTDNNAVRVFDLTTLGDSQTPMEAESGCLDAILLCVVADSSECMTWIGNYLPCSSIVHIDRLDLLGYAPGSECASWTSTTSINDMIE